MDSFISLLGTILCTYIGVFLLD
jgi:hypothetical protein